jgi:membrane AbrB-like protein
MILTGLGAMVGLPFRIPSLVRSVMLAVLGCMLGAGFSPHVLDSVLIWFPSFAGLIVYTVVGSLLVTIYFRKVAGFDPITAYFASTPGGLSVMAIIGGAMGGDMQRISLAHAIRIVLVVFILGMGFRLLSVAPPADPLVAPSLAELPGELNPAAALLLIIATLTGVGAAMVLHLPSPALTGAMFGSALVHVSAVSTVQPPDELVAAAQVVIGAFIGCRFSGISFRSLLEMGRVATGSTLLLLLVACCFARALAPVLDIPFVTLLLAFSPGGLAEMCIIGLALGADVAFISAHHLLRIMLITALAPMVFRLLQRGAEKKIVP